jgi:hypothetical protein
MYNGDHEYNNMNIMANMILKYSWLKFIGMPLFIVYVDTHK